ncbi:Rhodanese-like protein [Lipomyces oligophaga]|uniref:Rhodanese-like protein n=1 Tax=Lipomyces oligophaga TaxID=45792 RepID=UPI0034CFAE3A
MDRSSPLAAMPPPTTLGGLPRGVTSFCRPGGHYPTQPSSFASRIHDRASFDSPTSTLAADLSQNFHIAKSSPVQATPRRSLLQSFSFGKDTAVKSTSPADIPSSPGNDFIDISPLPHKSSRNQLRQDPTDRSSATANPLRPDIRPAPRHKAFYSMDSSRASFMRVPKPIPLVALDSAFMDSPEHRPGPSRTVSLGLDTPSSRGSVPGDLDSPLLASAIGSGQGLGSGGFRPALNANSDSPLAALVARPSGKAQRAKYRRTHSMYQKPEEFLGTPTSQERASSNLAVVRSPQLDSSIYTTNLPHSAPPNSGDPFRRIDASTLIDLMDGQFKDQYDQLYVIDCRFEYEYDGGHIDGAINLNGIQDIEQKFLINPLKGGKRNLLVFHCEYSHERAPRMACHLRSCDRSANVANYPKLDFPDIYILNGGYRDFFSIYKTHCRPQQYIEMRSEKHVEDCEREMNRFRRSMKRTSSSFNGMGNTSVSSLSSTSFSGRSSSSLIDSSVLGSGGFHPDSGRSASFVFPPPRTSSIRLPFRQSSSFHPPLRTSSSGSSTSMSSASDSTADTDFTSDMEGIEFSQPTSFAF